MSQDKTFVSRLYDLIPKFQKHELVNREIISLLEEMPVNLELQAGFKRNVAQISSHSGDRNSRFDDWKKLFNWTTQSTSVLPILPPQTFCLIMILHESITGTQQTRRRKA